MNNQNIIKAAALIAEIDPALSSLFLAQPFNRHAIVTAFHRSLSNSNSFAHLADHIAVVCRSAIDSTCEEVAA